MEFPWGWWVDFRMEAEAEIRALTWNRSFLRGFYQPWRFELLIWWTFKIIKEFGKLKQHENQWISRAKQSMFRGLRIQDSIGDLKSHQLSEETFLSWKASKSWIRNFVSQPSMSRDSSNTKVSRQTFAQPFENYRNCRRLARSFLKDASGRFQFSLMKSKNYWFRTETKAIEVSTLKF